LLNHKKKDQTEQYVQKTLGMIRPIVDAIEADIFGIDDYEVEGNALR
jgi:hypothetical protein